MKHIRLVHQGAFNIGFDYARCGAATSVVAMAIDRRLGAGTQGSNGGCCDPATT
jgi:hypothetical protein